MYNYAGFQALQDTCTECARRAGELMFQVVNGVIDAELLQDMVVGARQRNDGVEMGALTLVITALDKVRKQKEIADGKA